MKLTVARAARFLRWMKLDFSGLEDPRKRRGKRHAHGGMMALLVGAFATGAATLRAAELLCERMTRRSKRSLGLKGNVSDTALYELLVRQPSANLPQLLVRQVKDALAAKTIRNDLFQCGVLAYDGKQTWVGKHDANPACQSRTKDDGSPYYQVFTQRACLVSSSARPVVAQQFIPGKTNEMASFAGLFNFTVKHFGSSFDVVTSDSGATSRENAALVNGAQKGYVFAIKGNQPTVYLAARGRLGCKDDPGDSERAGEAVTLDRAQGKDVIREVFRSQVLSPDPEVDFAGVRQLWRVRQTSISRDAKGAVRSRCVEDRYFIVNRVFSGERALKLVRLHWGIENGANWTLDMKLLEDNGSPCARGEGVLVTSWLRMLAYNLAAMFRTRLPKTHGELPSWDRAFKFLEDALRGLPWAEAEGFEATPA